MKVLIVLVAVASLFLPVAVFSQNASTGEMVYQKTCSFCHDSGVAGAPKLGDKAAWVPRLGKGMNELYGSALHGKDGMPPKGGNSALSDAEVKAAVDYMAGQSK